MTTEQLTTLRAIRDLTTPNTLAQRVNEAWLTLEGALALDDLIPLAQQIVGGLPRSAQTTGRVLFNDPDFLVWVSRNRDAITLALIGDNQ